MRLATRPATSLPMAVEPVTEISGRRPSSIIVDATSSFPPITRPARAPKPSSSRIGRTTLVRPMAVRGVFGLGFQTHASPQVKASIEFHAQTAIGKLNAVRTATTPRGCHCSRMAWPGRSEGMVSP